MYTNVSMGRGETLAPTGSGATSAWCGRCGVPGGVPGCSRERSGTPPGAFRGALGGENLSSEQKDGSTLSTNAGIERTHLAPPLELGYMLWFHGSRACFSRAGTGS